MPPQFAGLVFALLLAVTSCAEKEEATAVSSEQQISCRGGRVPFSPKVLDAPALADDEHPAIPAIRESLKTPTFEVRDTSPDVELRLLSEADGRATFALGDTSKIFSSLTFEKEAKGWDFANSSSSCFPTGWARGMRSSPWSLEHPLDPSDRRVQALVTEMNCAGAKSAEGRIEEPEIVITEGSVVVTIAVRPAKGNQTCPGNPETPFEFNLPEPLGDRELLDGFHVPPARPGTPMQTD
jgi:hypothetical protein